MLNRLLKGTFVVLLGVGMVSCGSGEAEKVEVETEAVEVGQESSEAPTQLERNGKERWEINNEMREYPANGAAIVQKYIDTDGTDYVALANGLEGQNSKLISSCTMDGEAHEMLHLWLVPHMALVEDLKQAASPEKAEYFVKELNESYANFDRYFK